LITSATQEEKDVAMAKATEEANKAKALIDQATSNNDVDIACFAAAFLVARTLIELIWAILLSFKGAISLLLVTMMLLRKKKMSLWLKQLKKLIKRKR
jgi:hypothetical protein